jgi:hypothetical protein
MPVSSSRTKWSAPTPSGQPPHPFVGIFHGRFLRPALTAELQARFEHRIHRVVANYVRFALIAGHEIGIHLFRVLSHKAKLRDAFGVKFVLVVKGHRFESEDCFARLVHRLDLLLETRRGRGDAEVTTVIYEDRYAGRHRHAENAGDKSVLVSWSRADANRGGLRGAGIANVDIIIDDG